MDNSENAKIIREQKNLLKSQTLQANEDKHYRVLQCFSSPYSQKLLAYLHYKEIPYKRVEANLDGHMEEIPKLVGQVIVPVMIAPDKQVLQDTTPIMEHFEQSYSHKRAIPDHERLAFIMWLIEEFADEYLPRVIMHTRWNNDLNRSAISHRIARGLSFAKVETAQQLAPMVLQRQSGIGQYLDIIRETQQKSIDQQILDLLAILEEHFESHQFILGDRPSLADFALYGPLRAHIFNDPASSETMEVYGSHTCNWLDTIANFGDTRGCVGQTEFGAWMSLNQDLPPSLQKLLVFISKTYLPIAISNAKAVANKDKTYTTQVYGEQITPRSHQYRAWSLEQLQNRYLALSKDSSAAITKDLNDTGILPIFMEQGILHCDLFDGFTPPFIKDGICDARVKYLGERAIRKTKA